MPDPSAKDLLKKLSGRPVMLTTLCGTFTQRPGNIKDVFDDFLLFLTQDDRVQDMPPTRNWIFLRNIGIVVEDQTVATEQIEIER